MESGSKCVEVESASKEYGKWAKAERVECASTRIGK